MRIAGKTYTDDLKIINGKVSAHWWRHRGHRLVGADIEDVMAAKPEVLVVGTGFAGRMRVPDDTLRLLSDKGITVVIKTTPQAVTAFNRLVNNGRAAAGAFHLAC
jgi:hypothetical protein